MRSQFSVTTNIIAAILILFIGNSAGHAQSPQELINQLTGKAEAPQRNAEQLSQAYQKAIDYLMPLMSADDVQSRYEPQIVLQDIGSYAARPGAELERETLAKVMITYIGQKEMPDTLREWFVLQIERIGKAESVPAMTKLLSSEDKHLRDYARRALEKNPNPGATEALLKELAATEDTTWKIGLINSLGLRGSKAAIKPIIEALNDRNTKVAAAAVKALSNIGDENSIQALLETAKKPNSSTATQAAEGLIDTAQTKLTQKDKIQAAKIFSSLCNNQAPTNIRAAAINGLIVCDAEKGNKEIINAIQDDNPKIRAAAVQAARLAPTKASTETLTQMLPELKPDSQVQVLCLIGERGDTSSLKSIKQVLNSENESIQLAAIDAIAKIGTETAAKELLLVAATGRGDIQEAAIDGLAIMTGAGVEETIKTQAASGDVNGRVVAINLLGLRHSPGATQILLGYASDNDEQISAASYKALVNVAGTDDIPALIGLLTNAKTSTARKNATATLKSILAKVPDNDKDKETKVIITKMQQAENGDVKLSLLSSLNALGGSTSLNIVIEATKSTDESMKDCGIRTLSDWPDYEAAKILLDIASKPETSLIHYVLTTRGAMRLIGAGYSAPIDERADLCMRAFDTARRDEEKRLIISTMGSLPSPKVAEKLLTFTSDENLKTEAALAVVELAGNMLRIDRNEARSLAQKIRDMNISEEVNDRADRIINGRFFGFPGGPRRERPGGMNRRR